MHVPALDTSFYSGPAAEEEAWLNLPRSKPSPEEGTVGIAGTVAAVQEGRMTLDAGGRKIAVDLGALSEEGVVKRIGRGDRVLVHGRMGESDLFDEAVIQARSIMPLRDVRQGKGGAAPQAR